MGIAEDAPNNNIAISRFYHSPICEHERCSGARSERPINPFIRHSSYHVVGNTQEIVVAASQGSINISRMLLTSSKVVNERANH